ncbi:8-amino-7-oxononanoate synthase [Sinomicrobium sp. FJxs]|uniref:8-amino-7-oxononanoate synthase n=2 Tax=Sinomicrobium weinanense TaxID=2842200 RepID=A0A926JNJ8_9FLAO|nr:8-amino-7-oxononanoate synthase [Sinomicrobium weinanense]MBU3124340.1 8-amino-7-oxononanoate synthase [Sinomicrobium weinanense]
MDFPEKLEARLRDREDKNALRQLPGKVMYTDFSSNDYLGLARSAKVYRQTERILKEGGIVQNGATGSRLLTGDHSLYSGAEEMLARFHKAGAALVFNSGYDANTGFFSSVPQRGDIVLYDELIHASIRDGIQTGNASAYKFRHNDPEDLEKKLLRGYEKVKGKYGGEFYVVTESVFSMDGDSPDLETIVVLAEKYKARLVVDEAHAVGVFGRAGEGLVQELGLQDRMFARVITFGKAMGCHGAAVLGPQRLKDYLVNFARSLIYTTALPPHSLATMLAAYRELSGMSFRSALQENIAFFKSELKTQRLDSCFVESGSAIHCCIIPGNENVRGIAGKLRDNGFDVKAILSPTVPRGQERLRFCLHSYNTKKEISEVLKLLATFVE